MSVEGNHITIGEDTYEVSMPWVCFVLEEHMSPEVYKTVKSDLDTMTLEQALAQTENRDKWMESLDKEIQSLEERATWTEVPVSEAKGDIVPVHWVMKIKRRPDGSLLKFKSRIVVRGDLMQGYDFETHSPTCAWSTVRMVLILAITWGWIT